MKARALLLEQSGLMDSEGSLVGSEASVVGDISAPLVDLNNVVARFELEDPSV